ncbi:unnamed protein product [Sphenostylis stenocarpa]|uniref:Uncharacterized protein n=1 Tax=Sphenostylis stenocarpa TaxID=92480 RepID=A0AA86SH94_9FABA|nr:unnamed protein product [Sphenostylis stenocarpa]
MALVKVQALTSHAYLAFFDSHYALTELTPSFLDLPRTLLNLPNLSVELTHHRIVQICWQHRERGSVVNNHAVISSAVHPRQHIRRQDSPLPYIYPDESNAVEIRMFRGRGLSWRRICVPRVNSREDDNVVVDNGTIFTMLPTSLYNAVVSEFD